LELSDEEYTALTSGHDCNMHSHEADRVVTHDSILQYQSSENMRKLVSSYTATYADDYLFVDSSSGAISIALPIARGGKFFCIVRVAGANNVVITPNGYDLINGASTLSVSSSYVAVRLKALKGTGWVQV